MRNRGFALMLVIWVLILLSIIATSFSSLVRVETRSGSWLSEQTKMQATAMAAIHRGILGASVRDKDQRWNPDGLAHELPWHDYQVSITLRSEGGKIDINYAPKSLLLGLFQNVLQNGESASLVDALIDWRDRDSQTSPLGAEATDYLSAGLSYVPSNGPFSSISELSQVLGFDSEMVEALRPHISIFAKRPKIDASSASVEVLAAIPGIERSMADQFISARDNSRLNNLPLDFTLLDTGRRFFDVRNNSSIISIEVDIVNNNKQRHRERAIVRLQSTKSEYELLAWETLANNSEEAL